MSQTTQSEFGRQVCKVHDIDNTSDGILSASVSEAFNGGGKGLKKLIRIETRSNIQIEQETGIKQLWWSGSLYVYIYIII